MAACASGWKTLQDWIGGVLGEPITCAFEDPAGTGDLHILTTERLAYWRKDTNSLNFTNNHGLGQGHWRLLDNQMLGWFGRPVDPSRRAVSLTVCKDIFAGYHAYPEDPLTYAWSGAAGLSHFAGRSLVTCVADTPPTIHASEANCFVMDDRPILIDSSSPCIYFRFLRHEDPVTLLAVNSEGCCIDDVQRLRWNGSGFRKLDEFEAARACRQNRFRSPLTFRPSTSSVAIDPEFRGSQLRLGGHCPIVLNTGPSSLSQSDQHGFSLLTDKNFSIAIAMPCCARATSSSW